MDLVCGARQVFVMTEHVTRHGAPKLVEACAHPLTGARCVTRVYTDIAVIDIGPSGFVLREKVDGLGLDEVRRMTGAPLAVEGGVGALALPPG
jgi:3-oxoadipate CoA-transferase beta subunit